MPTFSTGDHSLYYERHGSGPPLVLLHGLGSSSQDWERQRDALGAHFELILPDARGFGRSDKPRDGYSIPGMAADIVGLLDHLGLDQVDLLGFSMGGAMAFQMAVTAPARIRRLVILNSAPSFILEDWRHRAELKMRLSVVRLFGMKRLAPIIARKLFPDPDQAELVAVFKERYGANDPTAYLGALRALTSWSVADRLDAVTHDTLVLAADQDYTPVSHKEAYVQRLPRARLVVIPDSRHATPLDQTERFNEAVLDFLLGAGAQGPR